MVFCVSSSNRPRGACLAGSQINQVVEERLVVGRTMNRTTTYQHVEPVSYPVRFIMLSRGYIIG